MKNLSPLMLVAASMIASPLWAQQPDAPKQVQPVQTAEKQPSESKKEEAKPLAVGDKAPELKVESFVKGSAVNGFEKGKVYVVEFWATWCGPCIAAFPHLSKLQADYKDKVTIVGVNIWERPYNESTLDKVKEFVAEQGEKMAYTVAFDGKAAVTDSAWMKAAGRNGIPSAFIVDKEGKIAWMGHPMGMDKVLEEVVAGTYDISAAQKKAQAEKEAEGKMAGLRDKVTKAIRAEKWDEVMTSLDELAKADPDNKGRYVFSKFNLLMNRKQDFKAAYALKDQLMAEKDIAENAQMCNQLAWSIVDPAGDVAKKDRDLDFAMAFAVKANELTKGEDGAILDTLARVHWEKGDRVKAIELQEKAVKAIEKNAEADDTMKDEIKATLDSYKKEHAKSGA